MLDRSPSEIRTLGPDEVITENGFYQIPIERHHSQPCDGPSVTSGVLRRMELYTPADVWAFHQLNPARWEQKDTDALRLGRAMAAIIEGGVAELNNHFWVLPEDKPRKPTPAQIKAYQEGRSTDAGRRSVTFWRDAEADPRDLVSAEEFELMANMGAALAADPAIAAALGGSPEITMAVKDEETGLWLLSRPDNFSFDGVVSDYKKIAPGGRPFNASLVDQRITAHGYDMQMAFAADVMKRLTGEWPNAVGVVAQSDTPPFSVILRGFDDEDLEMAAFRNRRATRRFAECLASGHWPGPGEEVGIYQRPEWLRKRLLEDMDIAAA